MKRFPADVALIDAQLNGESGIEVCRRLRAEAMVPHQKLILLTGDDAHAAAAPELDAVHDGQAPRDVFAAALVSRVRLALRLKEAEERSDRLVGGLLSTNTQLEQAVQQRDYTAHQAQDVLIFAMAKMAELRGQETSGHLLRMQKYVRVLAGAAMRLPAFASLIDDAWVRMLERCVLLHDIGKVAIPDHILLKPGKLDAEERSIMESHTVLGADILEAVARQQGVCLAFLQMAIEIVPLAPRAVRRQRLPRGAGRRRHPAGGPHHRAGGRLRRHAVEAGLQAEPGPRPRPPAAAQTGPDAVRPGPDGRLSGV